MRNTVIINKKKTKKSGRGIIYVYIYDPVRRTYNKRHDIAFK